MYYLEINDIIRYYGDAIGFDSYNTSSHFTHAGIANRSETLMVRKTILKRVVNALAILSGQDQIKLIITDLDDTMWHGVAAEEDEICPAQHFEGWPIGYVEALLECKRRGILLAISSKNNEAETIENFRKIWGMKIQPEDFFSLKINWDAKSENIRQILDEANILPSNVLFIDDNPLEIEEVRSVYPEIRTLSIPQERWRDILLHSSSTQTAVLTLESKNRTELLRAKVERDKVLVTMNRDDYLHSLELQVRIAKIHDSSHAHIPRVLELLNKTNQFNTTGRRWTETELIGFFQKDQGFILAASVKDRLVNHGLTAIAIVSGTRIIQFVLSCRIFGLGIETTLLHSVMQSLRKEDDQGLSALAKNTGRNASSRDFYITNGFILNSTDYDGIQTWIGKDVPTVPDWIRLVCNQ